MKITRFALPLLVLMAALVVATPAFADSQLTVSSYSMYNGGTGSYVYQDNTYLPCPASACTTTGAALSGGTGKLTDGVSPTSSWYVDGNPTQWVGWAKTETNGSNPSVTFNFASTVTIDSVTVWVDNTIGAGGVGLPGSFSVNGTSYVIPPDNVNPDPRGYTLSGLDIVGDSVDVQFFQGPSEPWIMVGEVTFDGSTSASPVPEPGTMTLVAGGLALGWWRRRKARRA